MQNSASNLQTQAYQQIKNNILRANYEPGQKKFLKKILKLMWELAGRRFVKRSFICAMMV